MASFHGIYYPFAGSGASAGNIIFTLSNHPFQYLKKAPLGLPIAVSVYLV